MRDQSTLKRMRPSVRKIINLSPDRLIDSRPLREGAELPLLIEPVASGLELLIWASANRAFIESQLLKFGAILFRGFNLKSAAEFEQFIRAVSGELLEYTYASTPRRRVEGQIYTSTEYPAEATIPSHNEMSYSRNWPMKIFFFCAQPAQSGGETPIADSRRVFQSIAPEIRHEFERKGVMYARNYGEKLDLPWQKVFRTSERSEVEDYCRRAGIEFEWKAGNCLKTRQVCQAVSAHPKTGDKVWFNQAHLFHISNLSAEARQQLQASLPEDQLPRNAYYGDGAAIEDSVLDEIREKYEQEAVAFNWAKGDVLMLDNMLSSHGRRPFEGARQVLVGMSEPFGSAAI